MYRVFFSLELIVLLLFTCDDDKDVLADRLNAGDGLVGDLLPSIGGIAVEGELMLQNTWNSFYLI